MECKNLKFTGHAIRQMFQRQITKDDVRYVINYGEVITDYPDDKPLHSKLLLGFSKKRPLHIVLAYDITHKTCYVITAYAPEPKLWTDDYKRRK